MTTENKNKMFKRVIQDQALVERYEYNPDDYEDIVDGLQSNVPIVVAIAKIISNLDGATDTKTQTEVYLDVFNYLNGNLTK